MGLSKTWKDPLIKSWKESLRVFPRGRLLWHHWRSILYTVEKRVYQSFICIFLHTSPSMSLRTSTDFLTNWQQFSLFWMTVRKIRACFILESFQFLLGQSQFWICIPSITLEMRSCLSSISSKTLSETNCQKHISDKWTFKNKFVSNNYKLKKIEPICIELNFPVLVSFM